MNIRKTKPLMDLIQSLVDMGFTEIEIKQGKEGEESLRLGRQSHAPFHHAAPAHIPLPTLPNHIPAMSTSVVTSAPSQDSTPPTTADNNTHHVKAPMVGTLYISPSPDAEPFVKVGQTVKAGATLCIIEAMKMFNEIEADRSGTVTEILVKNGDPVEFGQPLFIIK